MRWSWIIAGSLAGLLGLSCLGNGRVRAEEIGAEHQAVIATGLEWVAKHQRKDGHWDANGQYPLAMTGLNAMVLLMQGSTIREGKYADNIRRAVDWLIAPGRPQPNGLLCNPNIP